MINYVLFFKVKYALDVGANITDFFEDYFKVFKTYCIFFTNLGFLMPQIVVFVSKFKATLATVCFVTRAKKYEGTIIDVLFKSSPHVFEHGLFLFFFSAGPLSVAQAGHDSHPRFRLRGHGALGAHHLQARISLHLLKHFF